MKEKAAENFEIRLAYVRDIASQKQQVLQELVTLSPVEVLRARIPGEDLIDIYVVAEKDEAGAQKVIFRARFLVADRKISDLEFFKAGESIEDIRMLAHACGAYAVTRNSEIDDLMLEAVALCERLMERDVQPAPAVQPKSTGGIRPG